MEEKTILELLDKLENSLICILCSKKCSNPVRIKICGHYFCEICLKKLQKQTCPQCKEFFEVSHLDYENIARRTEKYILYFQKTLSNKCVDKSPKKKEVRNESYAENTFQYNSKSYHINFVESVSGKLNAKGESPLHIACKKKNINGVKNLIEQKVDYNIKDYAGWAPLHEAVESQSLEIVQLLLTNGALVNIPGVDYTTPLHKAVLMNNMEMIKLLLKYGADKHALDYNCMKPIDCTTDKSIKDVLSENVTPVNITGELFLSNKIIIYCHSIEEEFKKKLRTSKRIQVETDLDTKKKKITHFVIKNTHKLSFKIIQAMLEGLQFLTVESIEDYLKGQYFIPILTYTFIENNTELNNGIRKSMISSLLKLPKLFNGMNFFIENHNLHIKVLNLKVDKEYLKKIIKCGGGNILHRAPALRTCAFNHSYYCDENSEAYRCCNYIIYEANNPPKLKYNMPELLHRSSEWLINCILHYQIVN